MKKNNELILIKKVTIVDPSSSFHKKTLDLLIENGEIKEIGKNLKESFGSKVIEFSGLHCSPGWFDMHVNVQDPGYEYKEDIDSALLAAAHGGYTGILSCSTTKPAIDGKSGVQYQLKKAQGHLCDLYVSGSISKEQKGKELAELFDMHQAGAKAFLDFKSNVDNTQLLKLAMLYSKSFDGLLMIQPNEAYLKNGTSINEGSISTENGLKGIPNIAEEMGVERALKLLDYTNHKLHLNAISTKEGVLLLKQAKQKDKNITAGVNAINLLLTDAVLVDFDSHYKLDPPLRSESDRLALIKALKAGTIDVIVSDHWPQNIENKECEFEQAEFGMASLESNYAVLNTALYEHIEEEQLIQIMAINPRKILGLEIPSIEKNKTANLTLYQPKAPFTFTASKSKSKARNTSVHQLELKGKVIGSINNGTYILNE